MPVGENIHDSGQPQINPLTGHPDQQFHLDPEKNRMETIVNDFNHGNFKDGVEQLRTLQEMDNHGVGDTWNRHIAKINGSVDLKKLGIADANQLLGVSDKGDLITTNGNDSKEQFRSAQDLKIKKEASMDPKYQSEITDTKTYESRLKTANEMASHPEPKGNSADEVHKIISAFNNGDVKGGTEALRKLQNEDKSKEPEQWIRHIAAVNANVDLNKLGMKDASQLLSVDDKGRLVTASNDLGKEQFRSAEDPSKVQETQSLEPTNLHLFTVGGDSKAYAQATEVAKLETEAKEAQKPLTPGDHRLSFTTSAGEQREIDVHVPPGYDGSKPMPTFYVLHNALIGGDVAHGEMENETSLNEKADKQGFIVAYPLAETHENDKNKLNALGHDFGFQYHSWNSPGAGMNVTYGNYDDVDYMKEATKLVDSRVKTDPDARYLLGFSEGAEFAPHVVGKMPGYWAGVGAWHPTREGTEASPDGDPVAYVQITSEKDKVLPRYGGTADDTLMGGIFGTLYPRLASSEPTAAFDRMAQSQGATGNPTVDKSDPKRIVTTYKSDQTATHRPVVDVDEINGEHAVDDNSGGFMTRAIGWVTGSKDRTFDSPQYMVDTLLKYRKNAPPPSETEGVFVP